MTAVYLSPLYAAFHVIIYIFYVIWFRRLGRIFSTGPFLAAVGIIWFFCGSSMAIGFFLKSGSLKNLLNMIGYCHLGVFMYMFIGMAAAVIACIVRALIRHESILHFTGSRFYVLVFGAALIFAAAVSVYGLVHARNVKLKEWSVSIEKQAGSMDSLKIALVSDMHLGYNTGAAQMEKTVSLINEQQPDIVLVCGDIFNNEYDSITDPDRITKILNGIQSRYGTYAVWGNHDVEEKVLAGFNFRSDEDKKPCDEMYEFLDKAGITLLEDEGVLIGDSICLFGRKDGEITEENGHSRFSAEEAAAWADLSLPLIVLAHEPDDLWALSDAGVDLELCGHTHNGQLFPANILMKFIWDNPYGLKTYGSMTNIVTSGCGVWGPAMRVATDCEVCIINCSFK